ncbi:hypothetical protein TIFTF001_015630 [Ficus carica]|uniref:Uncharacterized protein n=1 Tax=Ficus carica TaxID=3494 RepID=A0AA88A603_FICCA|nr:hypothetical protein TIFTF001_015630 [Ficus carica]
MSKFLSKTILFASLILRPSPSPTTSSILGFIRNPNVFQLRWLSSSSNQQSFAVSYLINSFGFSPESALSASRYVNFQTPEKPDKLIHLFKKYGFTQTQISSIVRISPKLLSFDAEKTILPKLEFFEAKGISGPEMAKMLSVFPTILRCSLDRQIMPSYDFVRNLFQSDETAVSAVKRFPDILRNVVKHVAPNVDILRSHGVPDPKIATLLKNWPKVFIASPNSFRKIVEKVECSGFDASKVNFVLAVVAFSIVDKSRWQSKINVYKKWGWSEEEVAKAFQRNPWCMVHSEDKLTASMNFFINQMGWRPCHLAKCTTILGLSLKKRVVPRCSVFQVLLSKGLVEKEVSLHALLIVPEEKFLQEFVLPYKEEAPELLKLYKQKLDRSSGPHIDDMIC